MKNPETEARAWMEREAAHPDPVVGVAHAHIARLLARIATLEATLKETRDACSVIDDEWDDRTGDGSARLLLRDIAKGEYP